MTPTPDQIITVPQIVDGFSYNTCLQYLPNRYWPHALQQLDTLRRAVGYRVRWMVIPDDIGEPIQPFDTYYFQGAVSGGSYLYGYMFASISAVGPNPDNPGGALIPVATTAADLNVNVTDSCTEVPLFLDLAAGGGLHSNFTARGLPVLLTKPRLILDPGLVNVEVANHTANTITAQLVLFFAESCKLITEETREADWDVVRQMLPARGMPRQWP
jgi:hypothetical protein